MPSDAFNLQQVTRDLHDASAEKRGRAMQDLLLWTRKDPRDRIDTALPIFLAAIDTETDTWTATSAITGIEFCVGPDAARASWRKLLWRADDTFVSRVALAAKDPSHVPMLLELLQTRPELTIRCNVSRVLGRSKDPAALLPLIGQLAEPQLRPDVILALEELEDPRAIPAIKPFLASTDVPGYDDDRGCMNSLADVAGMAIRRLEYVSAHPAASATSPNTTQTETATEAETPPGDGIAVLVMIGAIAGVLLLLALAWSLMRT